MYDIYQELKGWFTYAECAFLTLIRVSCVRLSCTVCIFHLKSPSLRHEKESDKTPHSFMIASFTPLNTLECSLDINSCALSIQIRRYADIFTYLF